MKWIALVIGVLVGLVAVIAIVGALRPADHVATITFRLATTRAGAWAVVSDVPRVPEWFPEVRSVERVADVDGRPAYRENYGGFTVTSVVREAVDGTRLVREILPNGSFWGTWTIELADDGSATRLTVTERGHVGNPLFRGMMVFADETKTMRQYAEALGRKLGTPAEFIPAP